MTAHPPAAATRPTARSPTTVERHPPHPSRTARTVPPCSCKSLGCLEWRDPHRHDLTGQHSPDIRSTYSIKGAGRMRRRRTKEGHPMAMERWRPFGLSTMDGWEPFRVADIQTEVNRLFENVLGRPASAAGRVWAPPVDMYATKDDLVLTLELPGVSEKEV